MWLQAANQAGLAERPTAIFAANDMSAFGAMDAVRNRTWSSPMIFRSSALMTFPRRLPSVPRSLPSTSR